MDRAEKAARQLQAVAVLRTLKGGRTYDELAELTDLPAGDLNRYVNGHVLPGADRALSILEDVGLDTVEAELEARVAVDEDGYVDTSGVVFDQPLLEFVAGTVAEAHGLERPDAVLTAATDGITFAAAMAAHFDCRCVYATDDKETGVETFHEARHRTAAGIQLTYYLPATALEGGDTVLVVDDLIRSGETQGLLLELAGAADATVAGVVALVAVGDEGLERARDRVEGPVAALLAR